MNMYCPSCGSVISEDSSFCSNCGCAIPSKLSCPQCGSEIEADDWFCVECGYKLKSDEASGAGADVPNVQEYVIGQVPLQVQSQLQSQQQKAEKALPKKSLMIAGAAALAVVVAGVIIFSVLVPSCSSNQSSGSSETAPVSTTSTTSESSSAASSDASSGASSSASSAASSGASSSASSGASDSNEPAVQKSISKYSWSDLTHIAQMMEKSKSTNDAVAIAKKYNIVDSEGNLTKDTIELPLNNGKKIQMQIVGLLHDDKADGAGKAAFTFMTRNAYGNHAMNSKDTNKGGWKASDMRKWLNGTVAKDIPAEVGIVPVKKLSNNTGKTESPSAVTETADSLFLFSWRELLGTIDWGTSNDVVFNEEGSHYELFSQNGVYGEQDNDPQQLLYKRKGDSSDDHSIWWVRSAKPNEDDGFGDFDNGEADNGGRSSVKQGVVFGFCI